MKDSGEMTRGMGLEEPSSSAEMFIRASTETTMLMATVFLLVKMELELRDGSDMEV
jgi:hypothetical protein